MPRLRVLRCSWSSAWVVGLLAASASWVGALLSGGAPALAETSQAQNADEAEIAVHAPLPPEASRELIQVDPGLRVELVLAEPQIESPVEITFDEEGRLWLVEMPDYPHGPPEGQAPEGRIKIFEDRNGDGTYDHVTVFAEGLLFANGVMPWRGGAIVTKAPEILWLKDTTGDGQADHRETLYVGFTAENPQLRVSHPTLGIDNWVYVANGLRGGSVRKAGHDDAEPIDLSGMDFRFDLIHDQAEAITGLGQYGLTFDDWGRRFVCDNQHHLRHIVLPDRYVKRNPMLAVPSAIEDISEVAMGEGGAGSRIYPISQTWTTSSLHEGHFTAACGVFVYRGDRLPEAYRGSVFTCDPTGNLVHQEVMRPHGATFRSKPPREGVEFLASRDPWFRPVNLTLGPDGALYLVDMYRAVIEHPEYMPVELQDRPDLTLGKHRGRIWRVVPDVAMDDPTPRPQLSRATLPELVALLEHPSAWWRMTAHRLLLERQDPKSHELLKNHIRESANALARLHAAWLLDGAGALDSELVLKLLKDDHPRVREHAVRLSESRLAHEPAIQEQVIARAEDSDDRVRFQVALSLGEWVDDQILEPLATVAVRGAGDRWTRLAIGTAIPERAGKLIHTLLKPESGLVAQVDADRLVLVRELSALVGARQDPEEAALVLSALAALDADQAERWRMAAVNGLADGLARRGARLGAFLESLTASASDTAKAEALIAPISELLEQAGAVAADANRDEDERLDAVRLLAHASWDVAAPVLRRLLTEDPNQAIRVAAARAITAQPHPEVAATLLGPWASYTPAVRREATQGLLRQADRAQALLDAMEDGRVQRGDLDAAHVRQLVNSSVPAVRDRARDLIQQSEQERQQVIERYQKALELPSDPDRGRVVFENQCATCHRVADVGVDVGPDIADTRVKTREGLLVDILNPNQAIDGNYVGYIVATTDGNILTGVIAAETASSITLRDSGGEETVVLRQDIEEIRSTGQSLMPEGLEESISVQEMADLLDFLKNWRYLDGAVPIGQARSSESEGQ